MIKPFEESHLDGIEIDFDETEKPQLGFMGDFRERAKMYMNHGITMSCFDDDGNFLGIGGVIKFWDGVGEAWILMTKAGRKKHLTAMKDMGFFLDYMFKEEGYHRIQCSVLEPFKTAHRCVMRLGFVPESTMVNYGPNGEHFVRYVRFA